MTDSPHNYSELIELAVLDAHGLLDPIESELFNRSFHNASASVQDEIIRLQHRLATDESLLPSDLPHASLKGKVIDAVAKAADTEAKRLAPLALIGARVGAARGNINTTGSIVMWRATAMILFGATVVLAILTFDSQRTATGLSQKVTALQARDSSLQDENGRLGLEIVLGNPLTQAHWLQREDGTNKNSIIFVSYRPSQDDGVNPYSNEVLDEFVRGYALGVRLEDGIEVIIQGITKNGDPFELARINADTALDVQPIKLTEDEFQNLKKDQYQNLIIVAFEAKTRASWI